MSLISLIALSISGSLLHTDATQQHYIQKEYTFEINRYTIEGVKYNDDDDRSYPTCIINTTHYLFIPARSVDDRDKNKYMVRFPLTPEGQQLIQDDLNWTDIG
eukprot:GHVR01030904.1.p1 GENE.GHVR01030904.1~~GHVR01030904.1.p1  ORF type:complete len:103 (-),score=19.39 GHVR01030904.1:58-366(-)